MYPMCFIIRPHAFISMFKTIISKCSTQLFRIKKKIKKKKKKKKNPFHSKQKPNYLKIS